MKATLFLICVLAANGMTGVVVSRDIHDQKTGEDWVIVETKDGAKTALINELKPIACSEAGLEEIKSKDFVASLMEVE